MISGWSAQPAAITSRTDEAQVDILMGSLLLLEGPRARRTDSTGIAGSYRVYLAHEFPARLSHDLRPGSPPAASVGSRVTNNPIKIYNPSPDGYVTTFPADGLHIISGVD